MARVARAWRGGLLLVVVGALLCPRSAPGLPVLRLFLNGEIDQLGAGGADAFRDLHGEALRLERPSLLSGARGRSLRLAVENESVLDLKAGSWAGTHAYDRKLRLTATAPVGQVLSGVPVVVFAGVERATGTLHLSNGTSGELLHSEEARDVVILGASTSLPYGLSLGGSLESSGDAPGWLLDARFQPAEPTTFWVRRRQAAYDYQLRVPDGVARKISSPELLYQIDNTRQETELGGELGLRDALWFRGGVVAESPNDYWTELGGRPLDWLALRLGADREVFRFDDTMEATGTGTIATVDLGMRRERLFGGGDVVLGPEDLLVARYVHSDLSGASRAEEVGTAASQAFMNVDYDLGLLFRGGYRLEGHQLAVGWRRAPADGVGWSVGAQLFRLILHPADFDLTSDALQRSLASEEFEPARADLLGLTGSIHVPLGRFRLAAAVGQYLPIATQQAGDGAEPSGGTKPDPDPDPDPDPTPTPPAPRPAQDAAGPYEWLTRGVGDFLDKLSKYGGGNRLMLELSTEF